MGVNKIEAIKFSPYQLQKLLSKLSIETGIDFGYYRGNFVEKRIKSRMIRLNLTDAQSYLKYINKNPDEIHRFKNGFTINTSYLFRNREVFEKIAYIIYLCMKEINKAACKNNSRKIALLNAPGIEINGNLISMLPELSVYKKLREPSTSSIYLWSCACASGEEPYSLAMMCDDFAQNTLSFPNYRIEASDIDNLVIQKAEMGTYSDESMKEVPKIYQLRYFKKVMERFGPKYSVNNEVKRKVEFIQEDVTKGHKKSYKYDIIFCRYFLIYTDRNSRDKILNILENRLAPGGLLVLGKTETLFNTRSNLKLIDTRNHIYVKKRLYSN